MTYHPPFVSERLGEVVFNGCTVRSTLAVRASASLGEFLQNADHEPLDAKAIHAYAEALEPGPPTQSQGYNPFDVQQWIDKRDPNAFDVPSWDSPRSPLRIDFATFRKGIINGGAGVLQGNPVRVKDKASPLKRFVNDAGHAIPVVDGGPNGGFVMDPMGLPVDTYTGQWVPWKDLEEFASAFTTTHVFCSLIARGSQTAAAQVQRKLDAANAHVATLNSSLTAANAKVTAAQSAQAKAEAAQKTAEAATALAQAAQKTAEDALAPAQAAAADLTAKLATANDTIAAQTTSLADLQGKLDTADATIALDAVTLADHDKHIATLMADLAACQSGAELAAANQKVSDLTTQNATLTKSLEACTKAAQSTATFFARLKAVLARFGL